MTGFAPNQSRRGSALLISLWALLLLSFAVLSWVGFINQNITLSREANAGLIARACAHSGVAVALHPLVTRQTPWLEQEFEGGRGYRVRLIGEGGKLNLNWLLTGENPARLDLLQRYLERRGLKFQERQILVDSLLDWTDPDNAHHLNGVEDAPGYRPPNRPLQSVAEVMQVNGSGPLVRQAGWEKDFTIYSQGPVDLLAAPFDILSLLPGIGDARAQRFIQVRQGPDKIDGTQDDFPFKQGMPEVVSYLGLTQQQAQQLSGFVVLNDATWSIESTGHYGKAYRQVNVVARKGNTAPTVLLWREW
jgi:type II secretory pathway component PulK